VRRDKAKQPVLLELFRTKKAPGCCRAKTSRQLSRGIPAWNHAAPLSSCCSANVMTSLCSTLDVGSIDFLLDLTVNQRKKNIYSKRSVAQMSGKYRWVWTDSTCSFHFVCSDNEHRLWWQTTPAYMNWQWPFLCRKCLRSHIRRTWTGSD
jgi:hypothetical protein